MKWSALLLMIFLSACKSKGPACFIDKADILKGAQKKLISVKDSGYRISALYDEGWDSLKGGAYILYPNEFLKSFTFYQNRAAVYNETYDEHGYLVHEQGSPMVNRVINEMNLDTAYVQVFFYDMMKTFQDLSIQINKNPPVLYKLQDDSLFANMKSVVFGINISDMDRINMYSRIIYTDNCTKVEHILSDSLFLIKDPHSGLVPAPVK
jgi:hypothetical protein